jgi:hypothetical protein
MPAGAPANASASREFRPIIWTAEREKLLLRKRRIELQTVTDRLLVIRGGGGQPGHAWCAGCAASVRMLKADEAAAAAGVGVRAVFRWVEAGVVHFTETPGGSVEICLNSLPAGQRRRES